MEISEMITNELLTAGNWRTGPGIQDALNKIRSRASLDRGTKFANKTASQLIAQNFLDNRDITNDQIIKVAYGTGFKIKDEYRQDYDQNVEDQIFKIEFKSADAGQVREDFPNYDKEPLHIVTVDAAAILTGIKPTEISNLAPDLGLTGTPQFFLWYAKSPWDNLGLGTILHDITDYLDDAFEAAFKDINDQRKDEKHHIKVESFNESLWGNENKYLSAAAMAIPALGEDIYNIVIDRIETIYDDLVIDGIDAIYDNSVDLVIDGIDDIFSYIEGLFEEAGVEPVDSDDDYSTLDKITSELGNIVASVAIGSFIYNDLDDFSVLELRDKIDKVLNAITPESWPTTTTGNLNLYNGIDQKGIGWGDVHFTTFDGRKYDLQSFGDFILAETARKDDDWIVQTRQDPAFWNHSVSLNTAFATLVDGQKVVFNTRFRNNRLQIDGVDFPLANGETKSIGNSKIERYNNKYTIKYAGNDGIIDIDDPKLIAFDYNNHLNIHIPDFATMQGLLGNNDGDPTNDFALRNGTQLPNNLTAQEIHNTYGESWRVQPEESLFENSAPNIDIPKKIISLEDFPQDQVQEAKNKVFEAGIIDPDRIDAVALDILGTGDEIFLTSAVEFFGFIDGTINSPPTDLNLDNTTILENAAPNSLVGILSTTDPDNGDSFTYGLVAGEGDTDNQAFTIDGNQLKINSSPDSETQSNYNIRVQTTDGEGASYQEQLTINVNDIIKGTAGRDNLTGTDDNDVIIGFQGRDIITGGEGEDQFVYINMRDAGDIITDFEVGSDKIVLTELFNSIGYSGSSPINDGYVSFSSQGENTVLLIDADGTGGRRASNLLKVENVNIDLFNNSDNFVF